MRTELTNLYYQLNKQQQRLFKVLYGSVETIEDRRIEWAIKQCLRSIENNVEKRDKKINDILN